MRCRYSSPASPLEDEDLLQEILLRLPPKPSSLPRASLVCTRWRSILSEPKFLRRFRKHHRKPPLLGFFAGPVGTTRFNAVLDSPDRIPYTRFTLPQRRSIYEYWHFMGCRHGLGVLFHPRGREIVVWDPLTGEQHRVTLPPIVDYKRGSVQAAVLCADAENGHVHGDCFLSPFKLVLICIAYNHGLVSLYDSASGVWENIVSVETTHIILGPSILAGNALCWLTYGGDVLAFDFETQSLSVIKKPGENHATHDWYFQLLRREDGGLGLAVLSELTILFWERKSNFDGVVGWVLLQKTIQLEELSPCIMHTDHKTVLIVGYDEETNVIVLSTMIGIFMLQLDSLQIRHIIKRDDICFDTFFPYTNFYTAGRGVGWKWLDLKL